MENEIQFVFHFLFSWKNWKTNYLNRPRLVLWLLLQVWSTRYSRASSCRVSWGFLLCNGQADIENPLLENSWCMLMFIAGCYFHIWFIFNDFLIVKVDLKYKQKPRKINVKDFILWSVAKITTLVWNIFSSSNKLFPLRRTYPH